MRSKEVVINNIQWTTTLKPKTGWFDINFQELWNYRDLILLFVKRDFVTFYKQTILGPLWFLIQPLVTTITFTIIFGNIAKIPTDGLPPMLFYMSGITAWNYFADCLNKTSNTFVQNAGIFGKVYFPRLSVPIAVVITNVLTFFIQFSFFLCFLAYFLLKGAAVNVQYHLLWLFPLLVLQMAVYGFGVGSIISSLTTKYRDLTFAVGFGVQLWMYATPIVYPMSQIAEKWRFLYALNPMASIVENFRYIFLGVGSVNSLYLLTGLGMTLLTLVLGILFFSKIEKNFMDTV